jgi:hypothetical protein
LAQSVFLPVQNKIFFYFLIFVAKTGRTTNFFPQQPGQDSQSTNHASLSYLPQLTGLEADTG